MSFEYAPQTASFPRMKTVQTGWSEDSIRIDGQAGDLVSYDAREPDYAGGRSIHVRVPLPENYTYMSAPAAERGVEFGINIVCRTNADCETALRIVRAVDFPPFRT